MAAKSINQQYLRWYRRTDAGLAWRYNTVWQQYNTEIQERLAAKRKELFPRKKKVALAESIVKAIYAEVKPKYEEDEKLLREAMEVRLGRRELQLNKLAPSVQPQPDYGAFHCVKTASTGSYASQGYGMHAYTKDSLLPYAVALSRKGFVAHIKFCMTSRQQGRWSVGDNGYYQLWTNCQRWAADAIFRVITVKDALRALPSTTNSKVLMPFLDYDLFDQHIHGDFRPAEPLPAGNPKIREITGYKQLGPWHTWQATYEDGTERFIEMLCPATGKDEIQVGEHLSAHVYAVAKQPRFQLDVLHPPQQA